MIYEKKHMVAELLKMTFKSGECKLDRPEVMENVSTYTTSYVCMYVCMYVCNGIYSLWVSCVHLKNGRHNICKYEQV